MENCCMNCIYKNRNNQCTARPISDGGPMYIPDNLIDEYICIYYKGNRKILNENKQVGEVKHER